MGAMFVRIWNLLSSVIIYDTSQTEVTSLHTSLNVILNCARHQLETKQQPNVFSDFPCFYFRTDCNKELYLLFPILMNFRFPAHHSNICKHYFGYQLHQIHASNQCSRFERQKANKYTKKHNNNKTRKTIFAGTREGEGKATTILFSLVLKHRKSVPFWKCYTILSMAKRTRKSTQVLDLR